MRRLFALDTRSWHALAGAFALVAVGTLTLGQDTAQAGATAAIAARTAAATPKTRPATAPTADELFFYTVAAGDTLIELQQRLLRPGFTWRQLQKFNAVSEPKRLAPGSTLRIPLAWLRQDVRVAKVLFVHGEVSVERSGSAPQALASGDTLHEGDTVQTGSQSSASFQLSDGSRVLLRPDSRLLVETNRVLGDPLDKRSTLNHRLRLLSGSADTHVKPIPSGANTRLDVRTPVVNLGVRGTEFRTRTGAALTQVEVLAGQVAAGTQSVDAGFGATALPGQVGAPQALLPPPQLSDVPARLDRLPLRLAWSPLAGAKRFRAQVLAQGPDGADDERLLLDGVFDEAQAQWPTDLPDGLYTLRVRGADDLGLEGRDARTRFVLKARPQPPFLTRPAPGESTSANRIELGWTQNSQAQRYRLQIAGSADFDAPLLDRSDIDTPTWVWESAAVGQFLWRVASVRADGDQGPWSDAQPLVRTLPAPAVPPSPSAPQVQAPDHNDAGMLLRWQGQAGQTFRVQLARDAGFATLLVDETVAQPQWMLAKPEPGTYYMRVAAISASGQRSGFGDVQVFEVPAMNSNWWWWLLPALLLLF